MKPFIAVVKAGKYRSFDTQAEAATHVRKYGGFVAPKPSEYKDFWVADMVAKTLTHDGVAETAALAQWDRDAHNGPILAQMAVLDFEANRPMRELLRNQEHGDVSAPDVVFAKQKVRTIDNQIAALRATLIP